MAGPPSGLLAVFLSLRPELGRFLNARGAQDAEAEDLLQDLYLRLREANVGPIAEPRAYLYRMANNLMLDLRRSATRRLRREEAWTDAGAGAQRDVDPQPSAEDTLLARERLKAVGDALAKLPERTREVFQRYRLGGEPQKTIALDLAISVSAVEKHLQHAYRAVIDARAAFDADLVAPHRLTGERDEHGA
jgi:RNA polymerase sigma-70 factor (ECF subfamily)